MSLLRLLQRNIPVPASNELRLLHEARTTYAGLRYADLSAELLARITRERGVDFATALLYDRIRRSPEHGAFIRDVEALAPDLDALPRLSGTVLVAPATLYREFPEFGGDGLLVRQIAADFGLDAVTVPVPTTGTVAENAEIIRRLLAVEQQEPVVIVSFSKGGADVRVALKEGGPALDNMCVWVQICGLVHGTPLVDLYLNGSWPRRALTRGFLLAAGASLDLLRDLSHAKGALLASPVRLPSGLLVINVVGFPLTCHLNGTTRARHRQLAARGPNDGSTLLRDAIIEPGLVYPVWGADHYFRVPQASQLLYQLFLYLAQAGYLMPARKASNHEHIPVV